MRFVVALGLLVGLLWQALHAQSPPAACDDQLAIAQKTLLVVQDERDRWQKQLAVVWLRAERAEAEVQRLKAETVKKEESP